MIFTQENSLIPYQLIGDNFDTLKALNLKQEIVNYLRQNKLYTPRYIEKLESCGTHTTHTLKERCGLVECPLCYLYDVYRQRKKIQQRQKKLSRLKFTTNLLTITFHDVTEWNFLTQYNDISKRFTRVIDNRQCKKLIAGTARTIETSFADTGLFHVHLHILLAYYGELEKEELKKIVRKVFPDCIKVHFHEQESPLNLLAFYDYVTKINDCEAYEWIAYRCLSKKKKKISFTGILNIRASPKKQKRKRQDIIISKLQ